MNKRKKPLPKRLREILEYADYVEGYAAAIQKLARELVEDYGGERKEGPKRRVVKCS